MQLLCSFYLQAGTMLLRIKTLHGSGAGKLQACRSFAYNGLLSALPTLASTAQPRGQQASCLQHRQGC